MPKKLLKYASDDEIPSELKSFKVADKSEVEVWVNSSQEALAAELNPGLAQSRDTVLDEKKKLETKYNDLLTSSAQTATELREAQVKLASATGVSAEELAIINTVKAVKADIKTDDLKQILTDFPNIQTELSTLKEEKEIGSLTDALGTNNKTVFETVWKSDAFNPNRDSVVWKDEQVNGVAVKTPYVKLKTAVDGKVEVPLKEYAEKTSEWTPFLPALTVKQQENGKSWLAQNPSNPNQPNPPKSALDDIIAKQNEANKARPNALYTPKVETAKT